MYIKDSVSPLKGAIFYGANASGKSNLVGLRFSKTLILLGSLLGFSETVQSLDNIRNKWSRVDI